MKTARAMVSSALVSLLLASCGENEFPTEPIKGQRASAQIVGEATGSSNVAVAAWSPVDGGEMDLLA